MDVKELSARSVLFTQRVDGWDLNITLIRGRHRDYLIDTGLGSDFADAVRAYQTPGNSLAVIYTHHHWDHVWGGGAFENALVVAHSKCREAILRTWDSGLEKHGGLRMGEAKMRLPDITFETALNFPEDDVFLFYSPGHTADSISVYDAIDKTLNAGDNIGDSQDELLPSLGCPKADYLTSLFLYRGLDARLFLSGHCSPLGPGTADRLLKLIG